MEWLDPRCHGEGAGAADGAAEHFGEGPGEVGDVVEREAGVGAGVELVGVAGHLFDLWGFGDDGVCNCLVYVLGDSKEGAYPSSSVSAQHRVPCPLSAPSAIDTSPLHTPA